jgi:hypothetical protein
MPDVDLPRSTGDGLRGVRDEKVDVGASGNYVEERRSVRRRLGKHTDDMQLSQAPTSPTDRNIEPACTTVVGLAWSQTTRIRRRNGASAARRGERLQPLCA